MRRQFVAAPRGATAAAFPSRSRVSGLDAGAPFGSLGRAVAKDDDDDLPILPRKRGGAARLVPDGRKPSRPMLRLMRVVRVLGLLLGGFVTLVGFMSLVGLLVDNGWVRFVGALVLGIALPAFAADRLLKRMGARGGLAMVADVFAIVLLAVAMAFVGLDAFTRGMLTAEGDRHARSGSRTMARAVYYVAGVAPRFFGDTGWRAPPGSPMVLPDGGVVPDAGEPLDAGAGGGK